MWTYWIKKEIARQFARSQEKRKKRFVDYRKTEILTLLIERESLDSILPIVKDLSKESIKLSLVVLGNGNALDVSAYPEMDILELTPENLRNSVNGYPIKMLSESLSGLIPGVMRFELVERLPFLYLMSISMARMKIGLQKVSLNPYDFMIRTSEDITARDLLEKILFYWRSIDIKDNNL